MRWRAYGIAAALCVAAGGCSARAGHCRGAPSELVAAPSVWGFNLAVDATSVYWTQYDPRAVWRLPLAGGIPAQVSGSGQGLFGLGMAVDEDTVFWPELLVTPSGFGVLSAPTAGGPAQLLARVAEGGYEGLVVEAQSVYFGGGGDLYQVSRAGGVAASLWSTPTGGLAWLALADGFVYFTTSGATAGVRRVATSGGAAETLAGGGTPSGGLALYGGHVYFASDGGLWRAPSAGGPSELLAGGLFASTNDRVLLAADGTGVYATSYETDATGHVGWGRVTWASLDGRATEVVALRQGLAIGPPVLDATHVYWATCCAPEGGTVMHAPKCSP